MCVSVCITISSMCDFCLKNIIFIYICNSLIIDGFVLSFVCVYTVCMAYSKSVHLPVV